MTLHPYMGLCHELLKKMTKYWAYSGDESDGNGRLRITTLRWRHPRVRRWMAILDLLHLTLRFVNGVRPSTGNFPLPRYDPAETTDGQHCIEKFNSSPMSGLPRNAYDPDWLETLTEGERTMLKMQPDFDFEFPDELIR